MTISRCSIGSVRFSLSQTACVAACAALTGCSADDLPASKLGNTTDLLVAPPEAPPPRVPVTLPEGGVDPFLIGEWVGHAEDLFASSDDSGQRPAYVFPSGSSEIYLSLDIQSMSGSRRPVGEVRFGSREAPPPQAGVAFGAGNEYYYSFLFDPEVQLPPVEGFAYALSESAQRLGVGSVRDTGYSAIGLSYAPLSAFENWCPLQPALPVGGGFSCSGAASWGGIADLSAGELCLIELPDDSEREIDCNLLALCDHFTGPCDCTQSGCVVKDDRLRETFWVAREGDQLIAHVTGNFEYDEPGHQMPIGVIRFDRVEP